MKPSSTRSVILCLAYVALHLAAQGLSRTFAISSGISVWYPPCGLALSLLVMLGPRYAPVVFAANVIGALAIPGYFRWWSPIVFPALITLNYATAALAIRRYIGARLLPGTMRGTLIFAATLLAAPVGAALMGTTVVTLAGNGPSGGFLLAASRWWLGDLSGLLTIVPIAMVFVAPWLEGKPHPAQRWRWNSRFLIKVAAHGGALVGTLWFVFSRDGLLAHDTLYICFLPLTWTCLRHGLPGATLATLVLVLGSMIGMRHASVEPDSYLISSMLFGLAVSVLGLGLGSAVTRREEAQLELSASRARFDRVISGAQVGLWDWDVEQNEVAYNTRCAEILRLSRSPGSLRQADWDRAIHPSDRTRNHEALQAHLRGESPLYECEYRIQTADGRWRWIHSRGSVVHRGGDGRPRLVSGTHADITERKLTEETAKRLLAIVETSTDFVLTVDSHGRIVYANAAFLGLLQEPALGRIEGRPFSSVLPAQSADVVQAELIPAALAKGSWQGDLTLTGRDRHAIPTSCVAIVHRDEAENGSLLSLVMRDISTQKEAEAANLEKERRSLQIQKAESLGVLAGGVAHDFNNLLTAIFGNATLLRMQLPRDDGNLARVTNIETAATRAADLCKNLLAYSGRVHLTLTEVNLNALVEESRELIHAAISKKIVIETELAADLPPIKGSAAQLQQVIINLALNARDAIGDQAGRIKFRTTHRRTGGATSGPGEPTLLNAADFVVLDVADTGSGIPEDVRSKIFEPYFTTKSQGHGLGLAAVNGIVRAHQGSIHVHSSVGHGTTFTLLLPALPPAARASTVTPPNTEAWRGSGLALIVDDEEMVCTVVARLVERMGFETITASNGAEGVKLFQIHHPDLRFVLTDLSMPIMNGDEAMTEMRRINPDVPVILMSGYPEKMAPDHFALASPSAVLVKPLRLPILEKTLSQVVCSA